MNLKNYSDLLMRLGVAFAFLYPAFDAILNPDSWIGYFPRFLQGFVPDAVLLHSFGVVEIIIALWILSGKKIFLPSLAATAILLFIVVFNAGEFEILFRDLSIAVIAFGLAIANYPSKQSKILEPVSKIIA